MHDKIQTTLSAAFDMGKDYKPAARDWLASHWEGFMSPAQLSRIRNTGVDAQLLKQARARGGTRPDVVGRICRRRARSRVTSTRCRAAPSPPAAH